MIESPFRFISKLATTDYEKVGRLTLKWSLIEHIIGNCLRVMKGMTMDEAITEIFPQKLQDKLKKIKSLGQQAKLDGDTRHALEELVLVMEGLRHVRNSVVHSVVMTDDPDRDAYFHSRTRKLDLSKEQVFGTEELTDYASHAAISFRYALGGKEAPAEPPPLPDRPAIPEFLLRAIQELRAQKKARHSPQPKSFPA